MSEFGKGQGWLPKYVRFSTSIPTSSLISRPMASSMDSPGSTNPASTLYIPGGKPGERARSTSSPRLMSTITAGLRRGGPAPLPVQGSDVVPKGGAQPELLLKGGRLGHAGRLFLAHEQPLFAKSEPQDGTLLRVLQRTKKRARRGGS